MFKYVDEPGRRACVSCKGELMRLLLNKHCIINTANVIPINVLLVYDYNVNAGSSWNRKQVTAERLTLDINLNYSFIKREY